MLLCNNIEIERIYINLMTFIKYVNLFGEYN